MVNCITEDPLRRILFNIKKLPQSTQSAFARRIEGEDCL